MQKYTCKTSELINVANANKRASLLRRITDKLDMATRGMRVRTGRKKRSKLKK